MNDYLFVEHSHGDVEGTTYDNVILSDGLLPIKVKNKTGKDNLPFSEGDKVKCQLSIKGHKSAIPVVTLLKIEKV